MSSMVANPQALSGPATFFGQPIGAIDLNTSRAVRIAMPQASHGLDIGRSDLDDVVDALSLYHNARQRWETDKTHDENFQRLEEAAAIIQDISEQSDTLGRYARSVLDIFLASWSWHGSRSGL